jgi:chromosomal replication initiator protein
MPLDISQSETSDAARERSSSGAHSSERGLGRVEDAGARVLDRLSAEVGRDRVHRYFDRQARLSLSGTTLDVTVASGFVADVVGRRFGDSLRRAAAAEIAAEGRLSPGRGAISESEQVELRINVDTGAFGIAPQPPSHAPAQDRAAPAPLTPGITSPPRRIESTPRKRFEDFLPGTSNRMAIAAAKRLAEESSHTPEAERIHGPLFIHGPCGVGKTHLLHAAAHVFRERNPGAVVRVITGEAFTNEFITAVKSGSLDSFRKHFRRVHFLCIDDVHFLSNKEATQRELLHTFDAVGTTGARILLASDEPPREIRKLSQQLVSRFAAGGVVKIDLPEQALRVAIAHQIAVRRGLMIEPAAATLLAERAAAAGGSVRDLEGLLTQVEALRLVMPELIPGGKIGLVAVRRALGLGEHTGLSGVGTRIRRPIPLSLIASEVCAALGVEVADLHGKGRHKTVVLAREMTVHVARRLTTCSFPEIARSMGRENHSTVLTAHRRVELLLLADERPKAEVPEEYIGLTLAELLQRLAQRVERIGA